MKKHSVAPGKETRFFIIKFGDGSKKKTDAAGANLVMNKDKRKWAIFNWKGEQIASKLFKG